MGSRKLDELSNARVPDDEIVAVPIQIIGEADQAITGAHDAEHSIDALAVEGEVEAGVFAEIFVVIPMQSVHFFFDNVPSQALTAFARFSEQSLKRRRGWSFLVAEWRR